MQPAIRPSFKHVFPSCLMMHSGAAECGLGGRKGIAGHELGVGPFAKKGVVGA